MNFKILILLVFAINVKTTQAQEEINVFGKLKFGIHEVGIKQLAFVDYLTEEPRKIQISLWYPAKENGIKLKFSDYMDYKNELNRSDLLQELSVGIAGMKKLFPIDSLELILNATMKASENTEEIDDKAPLLIWSSRYGTVEYQCVISEYLASHGYVVAFAEDLPNSPFPWQLPTKVEKENVLNLHVSDINSSIRFLKQRKNIDETRIGIISWSYAGESAILSQMSNPDLDLVIGLSSIGFSRGLYLGMELTMKIDLEKLSVPYLILSEKIGTNGMTRTPPAIFDSMHPNSRYVSFQRLAHGNFNGIEGMIPGVLRTNKVQGWSKGGEIAQIGFETICEITLSFIDAVFHGTNFAAFDANISLLKEDLPSGFISIFSPEK